MLEHFVFVILNLLLLLVFCQVGKKIENNSSISIRTYLPVIIAFTFVLGARYMRGNDYKHYQEVYVYGQDYEQHLFDSLNNFMHTINISNTGIFFVYSFIFIICSYWIIKYYKINAGVLLPLFLACYILFDEWFVRQALGFSFVFVFMAFLFDENKEVKKRILICIASSICAYLTHSVDILPILVILLFYFLYNKPLNYIYTIPVYLFATLFFQQNVDFTYLNPVFLLLGNAGHFNEYLAEGTNWFSADGMDNMYMRNPVVFILQIIGECSFLYLGYKVFKESKNEYCKSLTVLFNVTAVGLIVMQAFFLIELPRRIGETLYLFWCFPLAYMLSEYKNSKPKSIDKIAYVCLLFFIYGYLKYLFFRNDATSPYTFLWDAM